MFLTIQYLGQKPLNRSEVYSKAFHTSLALAPGMGLNAFFAYTVCIVLGYSWQFALTAVFIEGLIFILLTITNIREKLVTFFPILSRNHCVPV